MVTLWAIVCLAGLWGFLLCTFGLILKGFPARGIFDGSSALKWGTAVIFCFVTWMIGMANA
jgi:hypothetical protein